MWKEEEEAKDEDEAKDKGQARKEKSKSPRKWRKDESAKYLLGNKSKN